MTNNFNALLNAAVIATNNLVPAAVSNTGAHNAAAQGITAAVRGAAAHGAVNAAAADVATVARSGTTAPQWLDGESPMPAAPTNTSSSVPFPDMEPVVGALDLVDQTAFPTGLFVPNALHHADSTTGRLETNEDSQLGSACMGDTVNNPFVQDVPPPPPVEDTRENEEFPTLPPAVIARLLPPLPVVTLDDLHSVPLVFPENLFVPATAVPANVASPTAPAVSADPGSSGPVPDSGPSDEAFWADVDARAAKSRPWEEGPVADEYVLRGHHISATDCIMLLRWKDRRERTDSNALIAENSTQRKPQDSNLHEAMARCVANKNQELVFLKALRNADLAQPPHLRENVLTGAEIDAQLKLERVRETRLLAGAQAAFVADCFFTEGFPAPPPPSPPPSPPPQRRRRRSIWFAVAGMLTRKRDAEDDPVRQPAERARVEQEQQPEPPFAFLRCLPVEPLPRPWAGAEAATHPQLLQRPVKASKTVHYYTSDVAMPADEEPANAPDSGPFCLSPSPASTFADTSPSWQPSGSEAPLSSLADSGEISSPAAPDEPTCTNGRRRVHFAASYSLHHYGPPPSAWSVLRTTTTTSLKRWLRLARRGAARRAQAGESSAATANEGDEKKVDGE